MAKNKKYFEEGSYFFKLLRFFNLMEPEKPVLSLSKFLLIAMIWMFVYTTLNHPDQMAAVLTAGGGIAIALANYGYRRHMQHHSGMMGMDWNMNNYQVPHNPFLNQAAENPAVNPFGGIQAPPPETDGLEPNPE